MEKAQVEYNSKGKNGLWDANRLVREYIGIAWMTNDSIPFQKLPWDSQVRIRRVAAVIGAYLANNQKESDPFDVISSVFSNFDNRKVLSESNVDVSDFEQLKKKLCEVSDESWRMEHMLKQFQLNEDREQLLNVLLRYRIATEELENTFSGILEARTGAYIGTKALQGLYNSKLQECNRRVDDMIVLLLGSTFKRTFTERELIEHYNYPATTDDELLDWQTDNL
ncbi:hypothetical protein [Segatella copri]|uniref:Uncharacterized protein n=1 Tax=Segatella copri TaxID=165179 RepID=A0AAW5UTL6_9BACT|nr:hypothetical protein [Segatella copri]MCW4141859.1 hypothetical protein [Segatella copri]MCW4145793.1 hypothetical protein [Segatella copri]MCW4165949.1 hypothetical protein [Segatella copri]